MSQNTDRIGKFFLKARVAAGLELASVADELGMSANDLERYETGTSAIPLNEIFALTNLYNISPDEVVALFYELSVDTEPAKKVGGKSVG